MCETGSSTEASVLILLLSLSLLLHTLFQLLVQLLYVNSVGLTPCSWLLCDIITAGHEL